MTVTIVDIRKAAERIKGIAFRTDMIESPTLNTLTGGRVFIKPECLQRTGSFKIRGAYNRIAAMSAEERDRGVVAFSSGNHAQGVAHAATLLGVRSTIVMPADAPTIKMENTKKYGATVVTYDRFTESREAIADDIAEKEGSIVVPSFDDPYIIAGQGTVGLEIAEDFKANGLTLDMAVINCGGGGLSSGASIAIKDTFPEALIQIVEPEDFDDTARSLASGKVEYIGEGISSICDALLSDHPGHQTLPILAENGAVAHGISDKEAKAAIRFAARELKLVMEPGGAASLAAVLAGKIDLKDKVGVIVASGGNIDPTFLSEILAEEGF